MLVAWEKQKGSVYLLARGPFERLTIPKRNATVREIRCKKRILHGFKRVGRVTERHVRTRLQLIQRLRGTNSLCIRAVLQQKARIYEIRNRERILSFSFSELSTSRRLRAGLQPFSRSLSTSILARIPYCLSFRTALVLQRIWIPGEPSPRVARITNKRFPRSSVLSSRNLSQPLATYRSNPAEFQTTAL